MTDTRVFRYEVLVDDHWHGIDLSGPILHVSSRSINKVEFWALCTDAVEARTEFFFVVGTGHAVPSAAEYVGTTVAPGGQLVWHLFRKVDKPGEYGQSPPAGKEINS